MLSARDEDGLRYYRDCLEMPFDADVAAQVLLVAARLREPGAIAERLLSQARHILAAASRPTGEVLTWVALPGEPPPRPFDDWPGWDCPAVTGRVLRARVEAEGAGSVPAWSRCAERLAQRADPDGGFSGAWYPSRIVTTALVVQGLAAAAKRNAPSVVCSALAEARQWLLQRVGSEGAESPTALETGHSVLALADSGGPPCFPGQWGHRLIGPEPALGRQLARGAVCLVS